MSRFNVATWLGLSCRLKIKVAGVLTSLLLVGLLPQVGCLDDSGGRLDADGGDWRATAGDSAPGDSAAGDMDILPAGDTWWPLPSDHLQDVLQQVLDANSDLPAVAAAVIDGGSLKALGSLGVRKYGDPTLVTRDDCFHLGSCTKAMTATLTGLLRAEGWIDWNTTLADAFTDLIDAGSMHLDYMPVTIAMLLAHRGGTTGNLPAEHPDIWGFMLSNTGSMISQRRWFVQELLSRTPAVTPGTVSRYSNSGYIIVGAALEQATGQAWEELLGEHILGPLGMDSCGFGAPASVGQVDQPWGHVEGGGVVFPIPPGPGADNPPALGPAGTVHCSLADWARFIRMHLEGAQDAEWFLPAEAFTMMHTSQGEDAYGNKHAMGWMVFNSGEQLWAEGPALYHSGSNTVFYTTVWIAPAHNAALLTATNMGGTDAFLALDGLTGTLIGIYLP